MCALALPRIVNLKPTGLDSSVNVSWILPDQWLHGAGVGVFAERKSNTNILFSSIDKSKNLKKSKGVTLLVFFKSRDNHVLMKIKCWYFTLFL